ncbi:MAG TPA: LamG domain-containing protein, partial [Chthoniobacteraceae bacterium]|nr:LamG domain-containing protein [Chthoniobacteraceae bacterium]
MATATNTSLVGDHNADEIVAAIVGFAREPLSEPLGPSTKNNKPIKVREAYDREFERYLVRMFLEQHPDAVAKFLDSDSARELPVEARLLASLALEPKASAARVAKLLPQLQRAPGQEEVLRLAQFPDEPGAGEALRAILSNPATRVSTLDALLAVRTRLEATKLGPMLADAARELLGGDVAAQELGIRLASSFKLPALEDALVSLVQRGAHAPPRAVSGAPPETPNDATHSPRDKPPSGNASTSGASGGAPNAAREARALPISLAALRALAEIGSTHSEFFAKLAETSPDPAIRDEALAALAASRASDAPAKVLALYPKLASPQRRTALDRLSTTKPGASAVVAALAAGTIPTADLDGSTLDRLQAVLGPDDPALTKLVDSLGALFRPVLMLDGSDDAWTQTNLSFDGPLTVETWIRLAPQGRKIDNADGILGVPGKLDINFFDAKLRVYVGGTIHDVIVAKKPITPALWTHVAAVRDAEGRWKLYIDGELDNAESKAPAPGALENVRIGWSGAKGGTQGALAEFRLWNRARTADEIRRDFDRVVAAAPSPPVVPAASAPRGQPGRRDVAGTTGGEDAAATSGLIFASSAGGWGVLQKGARIAKTSDLPPILTVDEAVALDAKFAKYRALAAQ